MWTVTGGTVDAWEYDPARGTIFPVSTSDGARLRMYEGGGALSAPR